MNKKGKSASKEFLEATTEFESEIKRDTKAELQKKINGYVFSKHKKDYDESIVNIVDYCMKNGFYNLNEDLISIFLDYISKSERLRHFNGFEPEQRLENVFKSFSSSGANTYHDSKITSVYQNDVEYFTDKIRKDKLTFTEADLDNITNLSEDSDSLAKRLKEQYDFDPSRIVGGNNQTSDISYLSDTPEKNTVINGLEKVQKKYENNPDNSDVVPDDRTSSKTLTNGKSNEDKKNIFRDFGGIREAETQDTNEEEIIIHGLDKLKVNKKTELLIEMRKEKENSDYNNKLNTNVIQKREPKTEPSAFDELTQGIAEYIEPITHKIIHEGY